MKIVSRFFENLDTFLLIKQKNEVPRYLELSQSQGEMIVVNEKTPSGGYQNPAGWINSN